MFIPISGSDLSASGDFYLSEVVAGDSNPEVCRRYQCEAIIRFAIIHVVN